MHVSYLAVSDSRCTVQIAGCNFACRGCFSPEKRVCGKDITAEELARLIPPDVTVMLAGGEPTLDRQGLLSLIRKLAGRQVILSTNGYLLDRSMLEDLEGTIVHIDLKALDPELHTWCTGKNNNSVLDAIRLLHELHFTFEVITVYIPGVVETGEVARIAQFLSGIGDIRYRIIRYVPTTGFSRRPEKWEIEDAVQAARKFLTGVSSSLEHRSHPPSRMIIPVG